MNQKTGGKYNGKNYSNANNSDKNAQSKNGLSLLIQSHRTAAKIAIRTQQKCKQKCK